TGKRASPEARGEEGSQQEVDWGDFYDIAVCSWGFAPSEFWQMTPAEWWRIHERKRPRDPQRDYAGSLNHNDVTRMREMMKKPLSEVLK
ncbi:MAG TPA: phage tail assembly chaperone, partial [Clostridia bacterium]|nr:phage tail assembly chaperone [Clostridia bacterium]